MNITTAPSDAEIDLTTRKTIGRGHLSNSRVADALEIFAGVLRDYPQDIESCLVLGDLYLAGEDGKTAEQLYRYAQKLDPQNREIHRRLILTQNEASTGPAESLPTEPEAIARLLQRLTGSPAPVPDEEIDRAAVLLDVIIHSPDPADQVARNLDQIDSLLPALIELNIRQARADGRPDLAEVLQELKKNIELQLESHTPVDMLCCASKAFGVDLPPARPRFRGRAAVLVPDERHLTGRTGLIVEGLAAAGCEVTVTSAPTLSPDCLPEVVIACNPHTNPRLLGAMAACTASGIPLILDLDADFEHLPINHPDYPSMGLGQPANARAYATALLLANQITVPNETLAASMSQAGYSARVIPDGWSRQNPLWERPSPPHDSVNIGWVGMTGQAEDLFQIRRIILRVLREFPQTNLIIIGDPQAYQLFDGIPQNRRLFLPSVGYEDYPYLLGQIDILLVPLRNRPFNYAQSDQVLMEAGIKKIPWIASPMQALGAWKTGGALASTADEWHTYLRQLVLDSELRSAMGNAGNQLAQTREVNNWNILWLDAIEEQVSNALASGVAAGLSPASEKG